MAAVVRTTEKQDQQPGSEMPPELYSKLMSQVTGDPGLPVSNPSVSMWQLPPHKTLSEVQSPHLPQTTDYAVIGSGISGCSVVKNLLDHPKLSSDATITVFEARTLTSGASGRNGGGLATYVPYTFDSMCEQFGQDQAVEIARFMYRTLDKMYKLGESYEELKVVSEIRRTRDVTGFLDMESYEAVKAGFKRVQELVPESNLQPEFLSPETAKKDLGVKVTGGVIRFNCGAFWPYRFITTMWQQIYTNHARRVNIETSTPVTDISYEEGQDYPYTLQTPRGMVKAKKVVHATNGYTGHLLPKLRAKIFPVKGFLSTQKAGSKFGQYSRDRTWSFFVEKKLHYDRNEQTSGVYYGNQSPNSGDIFWGSDAGDLDGVFSADDAQIPACTRSDLGTILPKLFNGWAEDEKPEVRELWAGILGYTADYLPLVGELPASVTGRGHGGEYISAGFNGAGMCQCWSSGEAVVKLLFEEDVSEVIPKPYLVTAERLQEPNMTKEKAFGSVFGDFWKH